MTMISEHRVSLYSPLLWYQCVDKEDEGTDRHRLINNYLTEGPVRIRFVTDLTQLLAVTMSQTVLFFMFITPHFYKHAGIFSDEQPEVAAVTCTFSSGSDLICSLSKTETTLRVKRLHSS